MIMKDGKDVTEEIMGKVKEYAFLEKESKNFKQAIGHLELAKDFLTSLHKPWQNDCVYDSIQKIDEILKDMKQNG